MYQIYTDFCKVKMYSLENQKVFINNSDSKYHMKKQNQIILITEDNDSSPAYLLQRCIGRDHTVQGWRLGWGRSGPQDSLYKMWLPQLSTGLCFKHR